MKLTFTTSIKAFVLVLSIAFFSQTGYSQTGAINQEGDKTSMQKNVFGFGTNVSLMSGIGVSFKEHFARNPLSYMVTGYVFKDKTGATYDFGLEVQYDFYMKEFTRFYALAGFSYFYNGTKGTQYDPIAGSLINTSEYNQLEGPKRFGVGIGFDIALGYSISFYGNVTLTSFQPVGDLLIYPYGGLMFYFN